MADAADGTDDAFPTLSTSGVFFRALVLSHLTDDLLTGDAIQRTVCAVDRLSVDSYDRKTMLYGYVRSQ